jgi:hypothetical protein
MKHAFLLSYFLFPIFSFALFAGCASAPPKPHTYLINDQNKPPLPGTIVITSPVNTDTLEWGVPYELPVDILWVSIHRIPMYLFPAGDTPGWLKVDIEPAQLDTSARVTVRLTAIGGQAPEGNLTFTLQAVSDSLPQTLDKSFSFYVRKQTGTFTRLQFGIEPTTCDSICAQITSYGQLIFYDLHGTTLPCSDSTNLPASKIIGVQGFALSQAGYAFGSTCRLAAVYEMNGTLTFVNLGLSGRLPPGAALLSLRGVSACWLSPDNTMALVLLSDVVMPYETTTGRTLGGPCRLTGDSITVSVHGKTLRAGMCKWELP